MSRTISSALKTHLQGDVTTVCVMWKVKTTHGVLKGFSSHVSDFTYDDGTGDGSIVYKASLGVSPTTTNQTIGSGIDTMKVIGILTDSNISDVDLILGVYDYSSLTIMLANYADLTMGHVVMMNGKIGEIVFHSTHFECEVRSLLQLCLQYIGSIVSANCDANFCDSRCKLNPATYTTTHSIATVIDQRSFTWNQSGFSDNIFASGILTWTSGLNNGYSYDVKLNTVATNYMELQDDCYYTINSGDTFSIIQGCAKNLQACFNYSNVINFRGFPFVPGVDALLNVVNAGSTSSGSGIEREISDRIPSR
jgi:uncharacterized phage protein (TIGR02218 family)